VFVLFVEIRIDCILYQKIVVVHVIDISLADHFVCFDKNHRFLKTNLLVECLSRVLRSISSIENIHRNALPSEKSTLPHPNWPAVKILTKVQPFLTDIFNGNDAP